MEPLRNPLEAAALLQRILEGEGVESMVIGGLAVAIWGEPRATRDADLKVLMTRDGAQPLLDALQCKGYELPAEAMEIVQRLGLLFVKDPGGVRFALLLVETSFDTEAVARSRAC